LRTADGNLRPQTWQQFFAHLAPAALPNLDRREAMLARQIRDDGLTYKRLPLHVGSAERPWSLDLLPLIIGADEWTDESRQGVAQRARLLNAR